MSRVHLFADEAGDVTFRRGDGVSAYFLIATVTMNDCSLGDRLLALKRDLAWQGIDIQAFHAKADRYSVKQQVYKLIAESDVRIDVTALEKAKTQPHIAANPEYFYKLALYQHFKYVVPLVATRADDVHVVASSLQLGRKKAALHDSVKDVVEQACGARRFVTSFAENKTDPCLQLADYAAWATQRLLERGDDQYYRLIEDRVRSRFEPFAQASMTYY